MIESFDGVMFVCIAQKTNDGDLLPDTFNVFPLIADPKESINKVARKIARQGREMGLESGTGTLCVMPISSWKQFAEIEVDDHVKMSALAVSISSAYMDSMSSDSMEQLMALPWLPAPLR